MVHLSPIPFVKEFKAFVMRGNVVDLAVGVIIGTAFGKIVSSLVADVIMPGIGFVTGSVNLNDYKWIIRPEMEGRVALTLNWGMFVQNILDFIVIALCIFLLIKLMAKFRKPVETAAPETHDTKTEVLLTEIRDLLKGETTVKEKKV